MTKYCAVLLALSLWATAAAATDGGTIVTLGNPSGPAGTALTVRWQIQETLPMVGAQFDVRLPPGLYWLDACTVNPAMERDDSRVAHPGNRLDTWRAIFITFENSAPWPAVDWVLECSIWIPTDAVPGRYPLTCERAMGGGTPIDWEPTAYHLGCALGEVMVTAGDCPGDLNGDHEVRVPEVVQSVTSLMQGCP